MIPYIIVSPAYRNCNAGVKALFMLCNKLRERGREAYMFSPIGLPHTFNAPSLASDIPGIREMIAKGAIVVYPDIIPFNELKALRPVLWNLGPDRGSNIPTKFYWSSGFPGADKLLCFDLIEHNLFNRLNLPERDINTLWVGKGFRDKFADTLPAIEITYNYPESREEVATLLKRSKAFYTYDGLTSLISEALFCNTPVVYIPNNSPYKLDSLSLKGISIGTEVRPTAREEIPEYREKYLQHYGGKSAEEMLNNFISITQNITSLQN